MSMNRTPLSARYSNGQTTAESGGILKGSTAHHPSPPAFKPKTQSPLSPRLTIASHCPSPSRSRKRTPKSFPCSQAVSAALGRATAAVHAVPSKDQALGLLTSSKSQKKTLAFPSGRV